MHELEENKEREQEVIYVGSSLNPWVTWGRAFGLIGVMVVIVWGLVSCYDQQSKLELEKYKINAEHGMYIDNNGIKKSFNE